MRKSLDLATEAIGDPGAGCARAVGEGEGTGMGVAMSPEGSSPEETSDTTWLDKGPGILGNEENLREGESEGAGVQFQEGNGDRKTQ